MGLIVLPKGSVWKPPLGAQVDPSHALSQGLLGLWLLNEGGGLIAVDATGNSNHGTIAGAWKAGRVGPSIDFNGTSQYISVAKPLVQANGTVTLWFKPDWSSGDSQNHGLFGAGVTPFTDFIRCEQYNNNNWYVGWYTSSTDYRVVIASSSMPVTSGKWSHLVLTWNDTTNVTKVYLDGVEKGSNSSLVTASLSGSLRFGAYDAASPAYFDGQYGEFRVYNRALSAAEVQQLFTQPFQNIQTQRRLLVSVSGTNVTVTPSVLSIASSVQSPSLSVTVAPGVLSATSSVQAPSISAGCTVSPAVLSVTSSVQSPTPSVSLAPSVLSAAAAQQSPTISAGCTVFPSVLSVASSVQAPAVSVSVFPGVLSAATSVQAPSVSGTANVFPGVLSSATSVQSPSLSVTVAPSVLSAAATVQAPTQSVTVFPSTLSVTSSVEAPSVSTGANATVSPSVLSVASSVQAPAVSVNVSPSVLSVSASIPSPSVSGGATVSPGVLSVASSIQTPTFGVSILPAVLSILSSAQAPAASGTANVSPGVLTLTVLLVSPASIGGEIGYNRIVLTGIINDRTVLSGNINDRTPITGYINDRSSLTGSLL